MAWDGSQGRGRNSLWKSTFPYLRATLSQGSHPLRGSSIGKGRKSTAPGPDSRLHH